MFWVSPGEMGGFQPVGEQPGPDKVLRDPRNRRHHSAIRVLSLREDLGLGSFGGADLKHVQSRQMPAKTFVS
jgi:hypothetical protein